MPLLDLLRRQGKDRKQFNHYFYDYICHCWGGRNLRVNMETLEEMLDAFEDINKCIVARTGVVGSLVYPNITGVWLRMTGKDVR